jgi:alginate O-acetyltransferase complex protein AlgI
MFLGGLWHGAAWSFAVWGIFHGVALVIERLLVHRIQLPDSIFIKAGKVLLVFSLVSIGWLFFKLQEFSYAVKYIAAIFTNTHIPVSVSGAAMISYILIYSSAVIFYHILYLYKQQNEYFRVKNIEFISYGTMVLLIIINSGSGKEFIYFQF